MTGCQPQRTSARSVLKQRRDACLKVDVGIALANRPAAVTTQIDGGSGSKRYSIVSVMTSSLIGLAAMRAKLPDVSTPYRKNTYVVASLRAICYVGLVIFSPRPHHRFPRASRSGLRWPCSCIEEGMAPESGGDRITSGDLRLNYTALGSSPFQVCRLLIHAQIKP